MGFVPSSSTIQLYAYFTEYARERIFNGDVPDFQVTQFSLHDEDINYQISKKTIGTDSSGNILYNTLQSGFLPDITGDIDSCIKSNKNSIVFGRNMLTGSTQVSTPVLGCTDSTATNYNPLATQNDGSCVYAPPTQRTLMMGIDIPTYTEPTPSSSKNHTYDFIVSLNALANDTSGGPTSEEALGSSFSVQILSYDTALIQNIAILPSNPIQFPAGGTVTCRLQFSKISLNPPEPLTEPITIKLKITPIQSNRVVEVGKDILTYNKTIIWN